jgi:hypothetical protein
MPGFSLIGKIRLGLELAAVLLVIGWVWNWYNKAPVVVGESVLGVTASEVASAGVEGVVVTMPVMTVRGGRALKEKLNLPKEVQNNDSKKVLDSVVVPEDGHRHKVTPVLNTVTGKTETFVETLPLPWFQFKTDGAVGVYTGISDVGEAARVQARQTFFSVKAVDFGGIASVDQPYGAASNNSNGSVPTRFFIGVGAEYRW